MRGVDNPRCELCRYWSDRHVRVVATGPLEAICLVRGSPHAGQYTTAGTTCTCFKPGAMAIDGPGGEHRFPNERRAA